LAWRLSITMEAAFCVETLEDVLARYGEPDVNTDQARSSPARSSPA
jgi:putative transposase